MLLSVRPLIILLQANVFTNSQLSELHQRIFDAMIKMHNENYKLYIKQQTIMTEIKSKILTTIFFCKTIRSTIESNDKTMALIVSRFNAFINQISHNNDERKIRYFFKLRIKSLKCLTRWKIAIVNIKYYDLSEFREEV